MGGLTSALNQMMMISVVEGQTIMHNLGLKFKTHRDVRTKMTGRCDASF
jgi:hypothetical protein